MSDQEQDALARLFGIGELPEVVVLPLELLEEIGRLHAALGAWLDDGWPGVRKEVGR